MHPRLPRDARVLRDPEARPPRPSTPTAGCTPATCARWTSAATAGRRPAEGHDHPRRREHLPARTRGPAVRPPVASARSRSSGCPTTSGARSVAAFVRPAPGAHVDKDELFAYMRDTPRTAQDPEALVRGRRVPAHRLAARSRSSSSASNGRKAPSPSCSSAGRLTRANGT